MSRREENPSVSLASSVLFRWPVEVERERMLETYVPGQLEKVVQLGQYSEVSEGALARYSPNATEPLTKPFLALLEAHASSLRELWLSGLVVARDATFVQLAALPLEKLIRLRMFNCRLENAGREALFRADWPCLERLELRWTDPVHRNFWCPDITEAAALVLGSRFPALQELTLSGVDIEDRSQQIEVTDWGGYSHGTTAGIATVRDLEARLRARWPALRVQG